VILSLREKVSLQRVVGKGVRDEQKKQKAYHDTLSSMLILVNFMLRDGWLVHCIADDAKTPISPFLRVASESTLLRLLRFCGATEKTMAEVERDMARWGRGSVWVNVTEDGKRLLRLRV
jgi:hypothetical protein